MKLNKLLLIILPGIFLCSCTPYTSKYRAKVLVRDIRESEATISFDEFKGRLVFDLKRTNKQDGLISYKSSLEEGTVKVSFYDILLDVVCDLFEIGGGQNIEDESGYVEGNHKYKIIIESYGTAYNGEFYFNIN